MKAKESTNKSKQELKIQLKKTIQIIKDLNF